MFDSSLLSFSGSEEWNQLPEPFAAAAGEIRCRQGIGDFLKDRRVSTTGKGIGGLLEADSPLDQAIGNPVMLVQAEASRKRQVGADPHKDAPPLGIVDVEVVLNDPALFQFQMPTVFLFCSDSRHDARGFPRLEDADDLVWHGRFEIPLHKLIAPAVRSIQNRCSPFLGSIDGPVLELCGNVA